MRRHQFSLHMNVYSILIFFCGSIYVLLALHPPDLSLFPLCSDDEISHIGACEVLIVLDEDSHLLFLLIAVSKVPVEEVNGEVDRLLIPCRVVRLVYILQLLYPGTGSLVKLHHIFALHAFIHQRSDKEDRLVNTADVLQRFQLFDVKEMLLLDAIPQIIQYPLDNEPWQHGSIFPDLLDQRPERSVGRVEDTGYNIVSELALVEVENNSKQGKNYSQLPPSIAPTAGTACFPTLASFSPCNPGLEPHSGPRRCGCPATDQTPKNQTGIRSTPSPQVALDIARLDKRRLTLDSRATIAVAVDHTDVGLPGILVVAVLEELIAIVEESGIGPGVAISPLLAEVEGRVGGAVGPQQAIDEGFHSQRILLCYISTFHNMIRFIALLAILATAHSTLVITSPLVTDFPNNSIPYFYANFGEVTYGKTLSFDLKIMENGLCEKPAEYEQLKKPTYLVVRTNYHETCSLTKRAEVAQLIGAKGLVVATPTADYAQGNVIQADDGNGRKVHITCLFITTSSFNTLQQLGKVEIIANYPVPQAKVSTVSLFLSAAKHSTYVFLRQFSKEYSHLKGHINIEPIYHTISCETCNNDNCFLNFCCYDFQNGQQKVGQLILREQIHQQAIFTQRGAQKWMSYMNLFDEYCDGDWNALEDCTASILKMMGMDDVALLHPIDDTLRSWKIREVQMGFNSFPEVAVNSMVYEGNLDIDDVVLTICQSLTTPPKYCKERFQKATVVSKSHKNVITVLLFTVCTLLIVVALAVCCYRNFIRSELPRDMVGKVGEIIANYASNLSAQKKKKKERMVEAFEEEL